jgi:hypothetical protein
MRRAALLVLAMLLAGCGALESFVHTAKRQPPPAPAASAPAASAPAAKPMFGTSRPEELVAYLARLRTLGAAAVTAEAARQRQAAARNPTELTRVKAAIALFMAHAEDEAEIIALVEPVARNDSQDADLRAMASFLLVMASDRRRLRESAAARVRDERRAQEQLRSRADSAQERAEQLQQKLDALTALEKSLSDRQPASR